MTPQDRNRGLPEFAQELTRPDFHMAFVFDTPENGGRLFKIGLRILRDFNREFLFQFSVCDYGKFYRSTAATLNQGSGADVILMAASAPLPISFLGWFEKWAAQRRTTPAALAVELQGEADGQMPTLQRICAVNGIELMMRGVLAMRTQDTGSGGTQNETRERHPEAVASDVGSSAGFPA